MVDPSAIDAGVELIRSRRFLRARLDQVRSLDFWKALNPELTISDRPFAVATARASVDDSIVERARRQIVEDGYVEAPAVVDGDRIARLRSGIERVVQAGFPPGFACVYDEFCQAFTGLEELFDPLLGKKYLFVPVDFWIYHVVPGEAGYGPNGGAPPHRDGLGPDPAVMTGQMPSVLNVWIPLTDVTPADSCIYVVPACGDPDYRSSDRDVHADRIRLQDIRAVPATLGSVLAWSTHLIHWGSRSSQSAGGPRVAIAAYFQRGDVPRVHPFAVEFGARVPFPARLAWIADRLSMPEINGA